MAFNIEKYLSEVGVRFKTNSARTHYILHSCPGCKKSNKLYVNSETGQFICHYCVDRSDSDMKGGLVNLVGKLSGISYTEAYAKVFSKTLTPEQRKSFFAPELLFGKTNKSGDEDDDQELGILEEYYELIENGLVVDLDEKLHPRAFGYLTQRGLSAEDIKRADCKILSINNPNALVDALKRLKVDLFYKQFIGRIIFPVRRNNRVVGLLGRDYGGFHGKLKILNTKSNFRAVTLWNLDQIKGSDTVVICESIINAIKCGVHRSVATFGKFITPAQYNELFKLDRETKIILMPDVDAQDAAADNAKTLSCHFNQVMIASLPKVLASNNKDYLDAGDYSKEENELHILKASPFKEPVMDAFNSDYVAKLTKAENKRVEREKANRFNKYKGLPQK